VSGFRIAFFGLPLAACLLSEDGHDVCFAVLAPIAGPPGRRRLARKIGEERVIEAGMAGDALETIIDQRLSMCRPDLLVSWFWTRKLPARWLRTARLGGVGVHPSLLPRHRGPDPYFWAIDTGDVISGVTLHQLTPEYDDGHILLQATLATEGRNAWQLARALDRPSLRVLREGVSRMAGRRALTPTPQRPEQATWAPSPEGPLLRVTWSWPTERVLRRIRALSPEPGLALELAGVKLFVTAAEETSAFARALEPGEAGVEGAPPFRAVIRTGDGAIAVTGAVLAEGEDPVRPELDASAVAAIVDSSRAAPAEPTDPHY
jgi:methionyl-tRNA formyltransferase